MTHQTKGFDEHQGLLMGGPEEEVRLGDRFADKVEMEELDRAAMDGGTTPMEIEIIKSRSGSQQSEKEQAKDVIGMKEEVGTEED